MDGAYTDFSTGKEIAYLISTKCRSNSVYELFTEVCAWVTEFTDGTNVCRVAKSRSDYKKLLESLETKY